MAAFTVTLEHSVVVSVVAVRARIAGFDILLGLTRFKLTFLVPAVSLDKLFLRTFHQFLLRFQPKLDAVPARLTRGLPFLIGLTRMSSWKTILPSRPLSRGRIRQGRWLTWVSLRQGCMFVVMLAHDSAPFDPEIV